MTKKTYIVTSIPYANGNPHMGHTLDPLYGDVLNSYYRIQGKDSVLQVGLDENGQKVYQKAQSEKMSMSEWLKKIRPVFYDFEKKMNINYQIFTQTSDRKIHYPAAQEMWKRAEKNGDIYKKKYKGLYCVGCEAFVGKKDLVNGKCPDHQKKPELVKEENYFFALSRYRKFLKDYFDKHKKFVQPKNYYHEAYNLIDKLEDVSISRPKERLPWGVPVPGDDSHVMYVWFDALINYLSGVGFPSDLKKFNQYWPADVEIIGKDNNRWHTLLWPAMLKSANLKIPKVILIHGHITAKGGVKMSKTIGNVVDPIEMIDRYGADAFRYYLLSRIPLDNDGAFDKDLFHEVYNSDLASGLGNLVSRVATMINKYFDGEMTPGEYKIDFTTYEKAIEEFRFNEALSFLWSKLSELDKFIEERKPWELAKKSKKELKNILAKLVNGIVNINLRLLPFMPDTFDKIRNVFHESGKIKKSEPLFPRLEKK